MKNCDSALLLIFCFYLLSFLPSVAAQTPKKISVPQHTAPTAPQELQKDFKESQFKSHMINHFNDGCPTNSECSAQMGKAYKRWSETLSNFASEKEGWRLLDKFRKENGVPFEVWATSKASAQEGVIFWDSPCESHNKANEENYHLGIVMAKNLKDLAPLEKQGKIHFRFLKLYRGENKPILSFKALRGETPLYIDGNNLIYQKLEEGHSYGLSVTDSGNLGVVKIKKPNEFPRSLDCPEKLVKDLDKSTMPENLYAGVYCQQTWNMASNQYDIILVGWSCN